MLLTVGFIIGLVLSEYTTDPGALQACFASGSCRWGSSVVCHLLGTKCCLGYASWVGIYAGFDPLAESFDISLFSVLALEPTRARNRYYCHAIYCRTRDCSTRNIELGRANRPKVSGILFIIPLAAFIFPYVAERSQFLQDATLSRLDRYWTTVTRPRIKTLM